VRKGLFEAQWEYKVVKKRVLLKSLEGEDVEAIELDVLGWSVAILCAYEDEYAPLKVMNTSVKKLQDDKKREDASFEYVGWRFDGKWQDGWYVSELANIPSREELISKLLYLVKYPLQWFAMAMSEIAKKWEWKDVKVGDLIVEKAVEAAPAAEEKAE
jgi:large subunit ribosomal protein L10